MKKKIFESACHGGNQGMTGILAGARAIEKEQAQAAKNGTERKGRKWIDTTRARPSGRAGSCVVRLASPPRQWSSPRARRLESLSEPRNFFDVRRACLEPCRGLVGGRARGRTIAFCISAISLSRAATRFCACVRCCRLSIISTPSDVIRVPASATNRSFTSTGNDDARTSKRSSTAVATLFTF